MINNLPMTYARFVVYREIDGANWFWGSWSDRDRANEVALEIGGSLWDSES